MEGWVGLGWFGLVKDEGLHSMVKVVAKMAEVGIEKGDICSCLLALLWRKDKCYRFMVFCFGYMYEV